MTAIPQILYKYVDLEGAKKILFNNTLKATPPNKFNDPFEMLAGGVCNISQEYILDQLKSCDYYKKQKIQDYLLIVIRDILSILTPIPD
jgi:hypothetical protein